jgi:hypothetical protein
VRRRLAELRAEKRQVMLESAMIREDLVQQARIFSRIWHDAMGLVVTAASFAKGWKLMRGSSTDKLEAREPERLREETPPDRC